MTLASVESVIDQLTSDAGDVRPTEVPDSPESLILTRARDRETCFEAVRAVPTFLVPRRRVLGDVQRLGMLADALGQSGWRENAGSEAREKLVDVLESQYSTHRHAAAYTGVVREAGTIPVHP